MIASMHILFTRKRGERGTGAVWQLTVAEFRLKARHPCCPPHPGDGELPSVATIAICMAEVLIWGSRGGIGRLVEC